MVDVEATCWDSQPALARLHLEILDRHQVLFASWGDYDRRQLERDCKLHRVKYPFGKRHLNVKQLFADRWHCRPCGMFQALEMARLGLEGTHHRALDDARNVTRLLVQLLR